MDFKKNDTTQRLAMSFGMKGSLLASTSNCLEENLILEEMKKIWKNFMQGLMMESSLDILLKENLTSATTIDSKRLLKVQVSRLMKIFRT